MTDWKLASVALLWASILVGLLLASRLYLRRMRAAAVAAFENFEEDSELRIISLRECRPSEYRRICPRGGCIGYRATVVDSSGGKGDCWLMYGSISPGDRWRLRVEWLASPDPEGF